MPHATFLKSIEQLGTEVLRQIRNGLGHPVVEAVRQP
jgi:hypothetical protein